MIEIVYNKPGNEPNGKVEIKLPRSVRQIGKGSDSRKIYIEDYVMSYINSLSKKKSDKLIVGVLLGNSMNDGEQYLFIKGAIKVKDFIYNEGKVVLGEKSWSGIYADIKKYFNSLNIMGWFVIVEDINDYHFVNMKKTHIDNFAGNDKTFFVFETDNNEGSFYFYENGDMVREDGYYVYYERNESMQEYMLVKEEGETVRELEPVIKEHESIRDTRKLLKFMYGVCSCLVVVVLLMALNIVKGSGRMANVEKNLDNLSIKFLTSDRGQVNKPEIVEVKGNVYETGVSKESVTEFVEEASTSAIENKTEPTTEVISSIENATTASISKFRLHTVAKGETLVSISKKYYGDDSKVAEIMTLNAIKDPNKIYLGQVIKLP